MTFEEHVEEYQSKQKKNLMELMEVEYDCGYKDGYNDASEDIKLFLQQLEKTDSKDRKRIYGVESFFSVINDFSLDESMIMFYKSECDNK